MFFKQALFLVTFCSWFAAMLLFESNQMMGYRTLGFSLICLALTFIEFEFHWFKSVRLFKGFLLFFGVAFCLIGAFLQDSKLACKFMAASMLMIIFVHLLIIKDKTLK